MIHFILEVCLICVAALNVETLIIYKYQILELFFINDIVANIVPYLFSHLNLDMLFKTFSCH